jgi:hypothetical protein
MSTQSRGAGYTIIDLSKEVAGKIAQELLGPLVEASAIEIANGVKAVINESKPTGRYYRIPGTKATYRASAPGEPPAERLNHYAVAWAGTPFVHTGNTVRAFATNPTTVGTRKKYALGDILERGARLPAGGLAGATGEEDAVAPAGGYLIEPRPHVQAGIIRAKPAIKAIIAGLAE